MSGPSAPLGENRKALLTPAPLSTTGPAVGVAAPLAGTAAEPAHGAPLAGARATRPDRFLRAAIPPLVLACLAVIAFLPFLGTGFPGTDSLTLVDTSRVASWSDLLGLLTQPVMAGTTFAQAEVVYRPFVSLTFALDYALWGLDGVGYHLTNLAIHIVATLGVWALLRSFRLSRPASFLGTVLFGLHPAVISAVPVVARRDSLAPVAAFVWSMALLSYATSETGRRRALYSIGSYVLFAVALLSKESAFAAALLVPVVIYAAATIRTGGRPRSLRHWARALGPYVAIGIVAFLARMAVLRAIGGYEGTSITTFDIDAYLILVEKFLRFLFWPVAGALAGWAARWLLLLAALLAVSTAAVCLLARRGGTAVAVGCLWVLAFALFHTAVKTFTGAWLVSFPLVGLALVAAGLLDALGATVRQLPRPGTPSSLAALGAGLISGATLAAFAVATVAASSLFTAYPEWAAAGGISTHYLDAAVACVRDAPDGTVLTLSNVPNALDYPSEANDLLAPTLVNDHTVESELKMVLPSHHYTVLVTSLGTVKGAISQVSTSCTGTGSARELAASY